MMVYAIALAVAPSYWLKKDNSFDQSRWDESLVQLDYSRLQDFHLLKNAKALPFEFKAYITAV